MADNIYLEGIKSNDSKVLKEIYTKFSSQTAKMVMSAGGTLEDARDVFQDALIVIHKKVHQDSLVLTSQFNTYLYSVCKFIWWKKRNKQKESVDVDSLPEMASDQKIEENYHQLERKKLFESKLNACLLYTSPSPRDLSTSRMPSSA